MLKLKTAQFRILTRSHTGEAPPASPDQLASIALGLRERAPGGEQRYRLVGVGLGNFRDPEPVAQAQPALF